MSFKEIEIEVLKDLAGYGNQENEWSYEEVVKQRDAKKTKVVFDEANVAVNLKSVRYIVCKCVSDFRHLPAYVACTKTEVELGIRIAEDISNRLNSSNKAG